MTGAGKTARAVRTQLLKWWREHGRVLPWRTASDPFHVLLAEVLLQKTPWWKVVRAYGEILARWPTPEALASAPLEELAEVVRPLGIVSRTPRVRDLAVAVAQRGGVPADEGELRALPGVGEYVARAVRCFAFRRPEPLVDSVSGRVLRRVFGLPETGEPGRDAVVWGLARAVVGRAKAAAVNWAVLDLGAAVCKPRRPRCAVCPLAGHCAWARTNYGRPRARPRGRRRGR